MNILAIDVGGTNAKLRTSQEDKVERFPTGPEFTPTGLMECFHRFAAARDCEAVSLGLPTQVVEGKVVLEPHNLGHGWIDFDFAKAFDRPVKVINDAAMQALGGYAGGRMVYLGLGTGVGSTMILEKTVIPLDLGQFHFRRNVLDYYLSKRGLARLGKKEWTRLVGEVVSMLKTGFMADYVMLGGGNAKKVDPLPPGASLGHNDNAFLGGFRLWNAAASLTPAIEPSSEENTVVKSNWKIA
ncbi:MAG: ROK family protein [Planctomycetales bacterium]